MSTTTYRPITDSERVERAKIHARRLVNLWEEMSSQERWNEVCDIWGHLEGDRYMASERRVTDA